MRRGIQKKSYGGSSVLDDSHGSTRDHQLWAQHLVHVYLLSQAAAEDVLVEGEVDGCNNLLL